MHEDYIHTHPPLPTARYSIIQLGEPGLHTVNKREHDLNQASLNRECDHSATVFYATTLTLLFYQNNYCNILSDYSIVTCETDRSP